MCTYTILYKYVQHTLAYLYASPLSRYKCTVSMCAYCYSSSSSSSSIALKLNPRIRCRFFPILSFFLVYIMLPIIPTSSCRVIVLWWSTATQPNPRGQVGGIATTRMTRWELLVALALVAGGRIFTLNVQLHGYLFSSDLYYIYVIGLKCSIQLIYVCIVYYLCSLKFVMHIIRSATGHILVQ